jgi:N-carbamoylputrescine amidase
MEAVRIGLIQMRCAEEPERNLDQALAMTEQAAAQGAQVVCLQELFRTPYLCQREDVELFDLAEPVPGPTTRAMGKLAAARKLVIIAPVFERRAAGVYHNAAVVIEANGEIAGCYRKMHIPDDPGYYEKFYFAPGDLGFLSHRTSRGELGVLICWDQWFPEAARLTAMAGAQILFYPTAIGWSRGEKPSARDKQREAWETIQRSHAIANGVYVAAVNRVGVEGEIEFWGNSFVAGPQGEVLASAGCAGEQVLLAECRLDQVERVRRLWPFLRDRRIDAYGGLLARWRR